ncbi:hypothetical protein IAR55_001139 [Kwoniella newhampshirensis]|uniref:Uncharacterized protein n=1 Tax=Kwoniella newhampshirensis TaxID=1651941 RepID=A0AAW0Z4U4_9TREE
MSFGGGGGSRGGRGAYPPRMKEDRDVLGYANKRVANNGPPSIQTIHRGPPRERGGRGGSRGAHLGGGAAPARGRGSRFRHDPPSGPRSIRPMHDSYRPEPPAFSSTHGSYRPPLYVSQRGFSPSRPTREESWQPQRRSPPVGTSSDNRREYPRYELPPRPHSSRPPANDNLERPRPDSSIVLSSHDLSGDPSPSSRPQTPPLHIKFSSPSASYNPNQVQMIDVLSSPPQSSNSVATSHPLPQRLKTPLATVPSTPAISIPDVAPSRITEQPASSSSNIPEEPTPLPQPSITKMKFRPKMPDPKGKGKEKEHMQNADTRIKAEPYPEVSAQSVEEEDHFMDDVKPGVDEELRMDNDNVQVRERPRREGVVALNASDLPPECFGPNPTIRKQARTKARQIQANKLAKDGKKIVKAYWRVDGVAYDWITVRPDSTTPTECPPPGKTSEVSPRSSNAVVSAEKADPIVESRMPEIRRGEGQSNGGSQARQILRESVPPDIEGMPPPPPAPITKEYLYEIPIPEKFGPPHERRGFDESGGFFVWRKRRYQEAAACDADGIPTRAVKVKLAPGALTLSVLVRPTPIESSQYWTNDMFPHQQVIPFPERWTTAKARKRVHDEVRRWEEKQREAFAKQDDRGRPTCAVKLQRRDKDIMILWREMTEDEIESYIGPLFGKDDRHDTVSQTMSSKSTGTGHSRTASPSDLSSRTTSEAPRTVSRNAFNVSPAPSTPGRPSEVTARVKRVPDSPIGSVHSTSSTFKEKKKKRRDRSQAEVSTNDDESVKADRPPKVKKKKSHHDVDMAESPPETAPDKRLIPTQPTNSSSCDQTQTKAVDAAASPALASLVTPLATMSSPELENLNAKLRQKVAEIAKWTKVLNEYPDMAQALDEQVRRTQAEIFDLHDLIRVEKERMGVN